VRGRFVQIRSRTRSALRYRLLVLGALWLCDAHGVAQPGGEEQCGMLSICDMALLLVGVEGERRRAPGRELMIQQEEQAGWFLCTRQGQRCEQVG